MPTSYSASSSSESVKIVNHIEEMLCDLFSPDGEPFAVTNEFMHELINSNAKILRAAIENGDEETIFAHWKEQLENYRSIMLSNNEYVERALVGGIETKIPIIDVNKLEKLMAGCPKPPRYRRSRP